MAPKKKNELKETEKLFVRNKVGVDTDPMVVAQVYERIAKIEVDEEPTKFNVYPDGMIYIPSLEFRAVQTYIKQHHESVLDVGCGRGIHLAYWLTKGFKVAWGCDISPTMVSECQKNGIPCREIDLNRPHLLMPYLPDGFDVVTCLHVLEHVQDPASVVKELFRIAKDLVVIVVPASKSYWSEGHINVWHTPEELVNGLGIEEHWTASLEQLIAKPKDVELGQSCYVLVIYKNLSK